MMIASDLDRTLIYSNRAIVQFERPEELTLRSVENRSGESVSFMTDYSYSLLENINSECLFVPVTTRSMEQYRRIFLFQQELLPHFAITSNGAHILLDGNPIADWADLLSVKIKRETAVMEEVIEFLKKEGYVFSNKRKQVEDLFFYFILTNPISNEDKQALSTLMRLFGWDVFLQGRKLYFIPKVINKGDALAFICTYTGVNAFVGAGDSIFDLDFLKRCRYSFVPSHGELVSSPDVEVPQGFYVTKNQGVLAGEEILKQILVLLNIC